VFLPFIPTAGPFPELCEVLPDISIVFHNVNWYIIFHFKTFCIVQCWITDLYSAIKAPPKSANQWVTFSTMDSDGSIVEDPCWVNCSALSSLFDEIFAPWKGILDSLGLWILHHGFRIQGTGFQSVSETLFWIPNVSGILNSLSCILDSKAQDSAFHEQKFLGFQIPQAKISQIWELKLQSTLLMQRLIIRFALTEFSVKIMPIP